MEKTHWILSPSRNSASFLLLFVRITDPREADFLFLPPSSPATWLLQSHFKEIALPKVTDDVFIAKSSILSTEISLMHLMLWTLPAGFSWKHANLVSMTLYALRFLSAKHRPLPLSLPPTAWMQILLQVSACPPRRFVFSFPLKERIYLFPCVICGFLRNCFFNPKWHTCITNSPLAFSRCKSYYHFKFSIWVTWLPSASSKGASSSQCCTTNIFPKHMQP